MCEYRFGHFVCNTELNRDALFRKRPFGSSISPNRDKSASRFSNAALFLENIKHEVENFDAVYSEGTPAKTQSPSKRRSSIDSRDISEVDIAGDSFRRTGIHSLKAIKYEDDEAGDRVDSTFSLFASLLDSALQGACFYPIYTGSDKVVSAKILTIVL